MHKDKNKWEKISCNNAHPGMYLGKLCKYGHEYKGTGKSLRYDSSNGCVVCSRNRSKRRYKEIKELCQYP